MALTPLKLENYHGARHYWCDAFKDPKIVNKRVVVRYDPFNIGIAYACVNDKWELCRSEYFALLNGRSLYEIKAITEEILKRSKNVKKGKRIPSIQLANFLKKIRSEEEILLEERQAAENRSINPTASLTIKQEKEVSMSSGFQSAQSEDSPKNDYLDEYNYGGRLEP